MKMIIMVVVVNKPKSESNRKNYNKQGKKISKFL